MNWLDLARILIPFIISVKKPELAPIASTIAHGVAEAEQIPGATGADKLQHVVNISTTAAEAVNIAAGKNLVDMDNFNKTLTDGINTAVAVTNLIHKS